MSKQVTNGYNTIVEEIGNQDVHELLVLGSFGHDEEKGAEIVHAYMGDIHAISGHIADLMERDETFTKIVSEAVARFMQRDLLRKIMGGCDDHCDCN